MSFCIFCHATRRNVYEGKKETVHYRDTIDARSSSADCHVPLAWIPELLRKIKVSNAIFHKIIDSTDGREL